MVLKGQKKPNMYTRLIGYFYRVNSHRERGQRFWWRCLRYLLWWRSCSSIALFRTETVHTCAHGFPVFGELADLADPSALPTQIFKHVDSPFQLWVIGHASYCCRGESSTAQGHDVLRFCQNSGGCRWTRAFGASNQGTETFDIQEQDGGHWKSSVNILAETVSGQRNVPSPKSLGHGEQYHRLLEMWNDGKNASQVGIERG